MGGGRARQNALRAGLVVVVSVAFSYLSFQVGFKPYLDRAQEAMDRLQDLPGEADSPTPPSDTSSVDPSLR